MEANTGFSGKGLIGGSIRFPHTVFTGTILVVLFGILAMQRIPLQMRPSVDKPEITVTTEYPGASPEEVEDKITRPLEEELNSVEGVRKLTSSSSQGRSQITLEFDWGINRDAAMVDVLNKLGRVRRLPEEASSPSAQAISSDTTQPMMWIGLQDIKNKDLGEQTTNKMRTLVDDIIGPRLRRVEGVGGMIISGGQEREVQIAVDLHQLAQYNIPLSRLIQVVRQSHLTVRGGPLDLGKREYLVWTSGRSTSMKAMENTVLMRTSQGVIRIKDVASVKLAYKRVSSLMHLNGKPGLAMGVLRKIGSNVPATAAGLEKTIVQLNKEFKQRDDPYRLKVLFTEVTYINDSIALVRSNLFVGAFLAIGVLLLFLGSLRSVFVIALSIPVSVVAVFLFMNLLGRSLNIVSLAGLAFAVGMVVDNAIVVLENIYRYVMEGKPLDQSCERGTSEVALAVSASTLTTVAVFLPIIFLQSEAGQIFKDIAIAISCAVAFSLLVSVTVIPTLCRLVLKEKKEGESPGVGWIIQIRDKAGHLFLSLYEKSLDLFVGPGKGVRRFSLLLFVVAVFVGSWTLVPDAEYLPSGNRNLIITLAKPLPGTNLLKVAAAAAPYEQFLLKQKEVQRIFTVFNPRFNAIGAILKKEYSGNEASQRMLQKLRRKAFSMPGFRFMFPIRASIFRTPGKQFEVEVSGPELGRLSSLARVMQGRLRAIPGVVSVRSNFEEGAMQLNVRPEKGMLREKGLSAASVAEIVQVALGGLRVGYYLAQGREVDLTLIGSQRKSTTPSSLRSMPIALASRKLVSLGAVARVKEERGPTAINRIEMVRSITLTVNLAKKASLSAVMNRAQEEILQPMRGVVPSGYTLRLGDTADRLRETIQDLGGSFAIALLISYLLMVALFRSFLYPFIIMATVPMAATGAFLAIGLTKVSFDTIAMLGLIILSGIVVNNGILIVHQTLTLRREGYDIVESLREGATSRLRPITMTALTSVLGMLPLAVGAGAGTELYRGLGVAIVGGLLLSTFVTLYFVPALVAMFDDLILVFQRKQPPAPPSHEDSWE
ncbi:MAG: efflux RND transporter permease subunit [Deltaproteobacteria bacterium]|nr:MAG: efflux RND transporter permease subunit [Deltaproteobacteria bacterium]